MVMQLCFSEFWFDRQQPVVRAYLTTPPPKAIMPSEEFAKKLVSRFLCNYMRCSNDSCSVYVLFLSYILLISLATISFNMKPGITPAAALGTVCKPLIILKGLVYYSIFLNLFSNFLQLEI